MYINLGPMGNIFNKNSESEEILKLKREIEQLKTLNSNLKNVIDNDSNNITNLRKEVEDKLKKENDENMEKLCDDLNQSIDNYVNEMLQDEEINSAIPDFIEKKIYKNVFKLIIKVMKSFTQSSKMSFLGQEISIKIDPKNNDL